jgi:BirA family biotin operon repressor/biotin-[acetyl-CoA-carboxylase] ligase
MMAQTQMRQTQMIRVLRELSAAHFRSGEEIALRLSLSRATVHNALSEARTLGLEIHSVTGRGYRLVEPVVWLDEDLLQAALGPHGFSIRVADQVASTNATLLRQAREVKAAAHKQILVTEWQSAGRGRRGRAWQAVPGGALLLSVLWRFDRPIAALSGLSLVVGLALVRALRRLGLAEAQMKWPNDILWRGRKLAGLLIELEGDMLSPGSAVIGLGLNIRLPDAMKTLIDQPAADLAEALGEIDRNRILTAILVALDATLAEFESGGFPALQTEWQMAHAFQGQAVRVQRGNTDALGEVLHGIAQGVDNQGALLLDTPQGRLILHSGEVTVRREL